MLSLVMTDFAHKNARHPLYIFEWRKHLTSHNQAAMADALGMPQSLYSNIESGSRRANADQLVAIAEFLEIEPGRLFWAPQNPINEVADTYLEIPEEDRQKALGLLKAFAQQHPKDT